MELPCVLYEDEEIRTVFTKDALDGMQGDIGAFESQLRKAMASL